MRVLNFLVLLFFISCKEVSNNKTFSKPNDKHRLVDSVNRELKQKTSLTMLNSPCIEFLNLIADIEKENWISDTIRIQNTKIYPELHREKVVLFNNHPFYHINFKHSKIYKTYNNNFIKKTNRRLTIF